MKRNSGKIGTAVILLSFLSMVTSIALLAETSGDISGQSPVIAKVVCKDLDEYVFSEGLCAVVRDGKVGFIDTCGKVAIDFQFYEVSMQPLGSFHNGICKVFQKDSATGEFIQTYIDQKGKVLFGDENFLRKAPFSEGVAIVETMDKKGDLTLRFINTQGQPLVGAVVPPFVSGRNLKFTPFREGLTPLWDEKTKSYGYINLVGKWAIAPQYDEAMPFHEGLAVVKNNKDSKWGFIDAKGVCANGFIFTRQPGNYSDGLALVINKEGAVGYIDKTGKLVIECNLEVGNSFVNGYTVAKLSGGVWAVIDKSGNMVMKLPYSARQMENGWFLYRVDGKMGVMNSKGEKLFEPIFVKIGEFADGLAYAYGCIDGKWQAGFINQKGQMVMVFEKPAVGF